MPQLIMPDAEYHAGTYSAGGDYLTFHDLKKYVENPAEYKRLRDGTSKVLKTDPKVFEYGTMMHSFFLEGERNWTIPPHQMLEDGKLNKRKKATKEWIAKQTLPVLTIEEENAVLELHQEFLHHQEAMDILGDSTCESVIRFEAEDEALGIQSRIDGINFDREIVWDLKTTNLFDTFENEIHKRGYAKQLVFYARLCEMEYHKPFRMAIVYIESKAPFRIGVQFIQDTRRKFKWSDGYFWPIHARDKELTTREQIEMGIDAFNTSMLYDIWPTHYEEPRLTYA